MGAHNLWRDWARICRVPPHANPTLSHMHTKTEPRSCSSETCAPCMIPRNVTASWSNPSGVERTNKAPPGSRVPVRVDGRKVSSARMITDPGKLSATPLAASALSLLPIGGIGTPRRTLQSNTPRTPPSGFEIISFVHTWRAFTIHAWNARPSRAVWAGPKTCGTHHVGPHPP